MFLAVWRRPGTLLASPLAARIASLVERAGARRVDDANAALIAWRPACIGQRPDGAYAYAAADPSGESFPGLPTALLQRGVLTLSAGPLPQSPIYYLASPEGDHLIACSQLQPLAALLPDAPINGRRLVSLAAYGFDTDTPDTVYTDIRRLRAGETVVADGDRIRVSRDFPRIADRYRTGKATDLAAEMRQRLDAAVVRGSGRAQRVAVLVSGGLDSSGVLALTAARCRQTAACELHPISIQYAGPGDDRPYLNELARALQLTPVSLHPRGAGRWFLPSLCMDGQPVTLASACLMLFASAAAAERNADAVLTGESGDLICGGPLPFARFAHLARRGSLRAALIGALRLRIPWPMDPIVRLRHATSLLVPRSLRRVKRLLSAPPKPPAWLTPRSRGMLARCREVDDRAAAEVPLPDDPDAWMRFLCTRTQMADGADALGQIMALTQCYPVDVFIDLEFVRFVLELDPLLLSHGDQYRGLYRLAMKGLLPERLRMRQDKAWFESAIAEAASAPDCLEAVRDLGTLRALAAGGLADPEPLGPTLDACLRALRGGERDERLPADEYLQELWQLLSAEAFLREHGRGRALA